MSESSDDNCVICCDSLNKDNMITITLPCHHTFHEDCLNDWRKQRRGYTCPICRAEYTSSEHIVTFDTGYRQTINERKIEILKAFCLKICFPSITIIFIIFMLFSSCEYHFIRCDYYNITNGS